MARPETEIDEEKKSRSVVFLLSTLALLVTGIWAVWNDNISRRPWKLFQHEFRNLEYERAQQALAAEHARLEADPKYQELTAQVAQARVSLEQGESAQQIAARRADLDALAKRLAIVDLDLRFVKSELEEAWYEYDHAKETGLDVTAPRARVDELEAHRVKTQQEFNELNREQARLEGEIKELQAGVKSIEDQIAEAATERTKLEQKLDALVVLKAGPVQMLQVPRIEQIVLEEFDRNAYNQPVARVDRCVSCHIGIDKPGFDDQPNPFKTHPDRERLLAKHPPDRFGCTPCHDGQGAAVNSVAQAHGNVPFWEHPLLTGDEVQARCSKCHMDVAGVEQAKSIAAGQTLFEELGCHGCHLVEGLEDLVKVGPYLRRIGAKVDPSWLTRWVTNPHEYRPKTKMPSFLFTPEQGTAVAAYLLNASAKEGREWLDAHPEPVGVNPAGADLVARGKQITQDVGCRGCHAFAPDEPQPLLGHEKDIAPNLANVAEKANKRWIYHWLKNPRHFSPVSRMPSLRLADDDAAAVTSYLLTLGTPKPEPAERLAALGQADNVHAGEKLVRKYGCAGCHDIPGMEKESRIGVELSIFGAKTVDELFFGERYDIPHTWEDWTFHKIKTPRTYATERIEQVMPQFDLPDEDIESLRLYLSSRNEHVVPLQYRYKPNDPGQQHIRQGQRLVARYNCTGCHIVEGKGGFIRTYYEQNPSFAPPILNGEGAKVQPDWLFSFLKGPTPIRPWLSVRMPTFNLSDEETNALVEYFTAMAREEIPFHYVDVAAIPGEHVEAAKQLMSKEYFDCFSCHVQGDKKPEGPPEGWAPDLTLAKYRLNPDWIIEWIRDPQKIQPGTKMPSFYPGGPEDILGGSDERQIEAIRDYLMVIGTPAEHGTLQMARRNGSGPSGAPSAAAQTE